jgi:hypothetical protein
VDFTREPIIETVITPKEGCKLVVRSSKNSGQEEYFVDSVEVVSFGNSFFFRSLERPKSFLVPSSDYEILEVREARMVLKNVGLERSIKIGGGRDATAKVVKEPLPEKVENDVPALEEANTTPSLVDSPAPGAEVRLDKKRDRRRHYRRRRGREESLAKEPGEVDPETGEVSDVKIELRAPLDENKDILSGPIAPSSVIIPSILPPPPTLISQTIARYKDNVMFRGAFFMKEETEKEKEKEDIPFVDGAEEKVKVENETSEEFSEHCKVEEENKEGEEKTDSSELHIHETPLQEESTLEITAEGDFEVPSEPSEAENHLP